VSKIRRSLKADLQLLGIEPREVQELINQLGPDWDAANEAFQALVRTRRKEAQRVAHPDAGGSVERSQEINAAADALLAGVQIGPPPAPPPATFRMVSFWSAGTSSTSTTSTGSGWFTTKMRF
jgi:hypothetical protein